MINEILIQVITNPFGCMAMCAELVAVSCGLPHQIIKMHRMKNANNISIPYFTCVTLASMGWIANSILETRNWFLLTSQIVGITLGSVFFCQVVYYKHVHARH